MKQTIRREVDGFELVNVVKLGCLSLSSGKGDVFPRCSARRCYSIWLKSGSEFMEPSVTGAAVQAAGDMSMWGLFMQADIIVKSVMVMLLLASFWCWAIIIDKVLRLRSLSSKADVFEEHFWSGGSLEELYDRINSRPTDPMSAIFVAAMREWRRAAAKEIDPGKQSASVCRSVLR